AREEERRFEQSLGVWKTCKWDGTGYRNLAAARALAVVAAAAVADTRLKADLYGLAARIEDEFRSVISTLVLSREDVEHTFARLRVDRNWPEVIPEESWERLLNTRYLHDITDVLCEGGDF